MSNSRKNLPLLAMMLALDGMGAVAWTSCSGSGKRSRPSAGVNRDRATATSSGIKS